MTTRRWIIGDSAGNSEAEQAKREAVLTLAAKTRGSIVSDQEFLRLAPNRRLALINAIVFGAPCAVIVGLLCVYPSSEVLSSGYLG